MSSTHSQKLVIAIASRALFDLSESHTVYEKKGLAAYAKYQVQHENEILTPGVAFPLVKKLLGLNAGQEQALVEVILLSRNSADTGLRIFNSIKHHNLDIVRAAFSNGESPYAYVSAFDCHLFLSANPEDVREALAAGCAAATIFSKPPLANETAQLRIAFDGDSVLFSDASERIYQTEGLSAFADNELQSANIPLEGGPFKPFLAALHKIQQAFPVDNSPLRTALVTARSAPAHERVIKTLRSWNIRIDEALFLGGLPKADFLKAFRADFFFDDQTHHCDSAALHIATGHVPHGVMNTPK
jgi:5'-nucleotidase